MAPRFSVSDFLAVVNQSLDMAFGLVEIEGEVAEFKVNHDKYVFFSLKDSSGDKAAVNCFMMIFQIRTPIEDGMRVVIRAVPKVTNRGAFSLTVKEIKLVGEGDIKRSADILRRKLASEGLFDDSRKRTLPEFPQRVGVISSVDAAGYADFMKIADHRWGGVKFLVANVKVQGVDSPDQIIEAIDYFNQMPNPPEVVVIIRGGGSAEDLSGFNDENLVRAVAGARSVTLTGVGHEIDHTLCDLAADVRASTPSNAAEILFPDKLNLINNLFNKVNGASQVVYRKLDLSLESVADSRVEAFDQWKQRLNVVKEKVALKKEIIQQYDPDLVLRRGYAMVRGDCRIGGTVEITMIDKIMKARVEKSEKR